MKNNQKYLICSLNDENYTEADYAIVSSFNEVLEHIEEVKKYIEDDYPWCDCEMKIEFEHRLCVSITVPELDRFYTMEIWVLPECDMGSHLCVWHHAYNGVAFDFFTYGSLDECKEYMEKDAKKRHKMLKGSKCDYKNDKQIVLDMGDEWEVWDIVSIKDIEI